MPNYFCIIICLDLFFVCRGVLLGEKALICLFVSLLPYAVAEVGMLLEKNIVRKISDERGGRVSARHDT
jgi:hypothetical protein